MRVLAVNIQARVLQQAYNYFLLSSTASVQVMQNSAQNNQNSSQCDHHVGATRMHSGGNASISISATVGKQQYTYRFPYVDHLGLLSMPAPYLLKKNHGPLTATVRTQNNESYSGYSRHPAQQLMKSLA